MKTVDEYLDALGYLSDYNGEEFNGEKFAIAINTMDELIRDFYKLKENYKTVCDLYNTLVESFNKQKKRMKQLEQENGKLKKQVHSYYMAMVTGKGE